MTDEQLAEAKAILRAEVKRIASAPHVGKVAPFKDGPLPPISLAHARYLREHGGAPR